MIWHFNLDYAFAVLLLDLHFLNRNQTHTFGLGDLEVSFCAIVCVYCNAYSSKKSIVVLCLNDGILINMFDSN